jgi:hypothetical protein
VYFYFISKRAGRTEGIPVVQPIAKLFVLRKSRGDTRPKSGRVLLVKIRDDIKKGFFKANQKEKISAGAAWKGGACARSHSSALVRRAGSLLKEIRNLKKGDLAGRGERPTSVRFTGL